MIRARKLSARWLGRDGGGRGWRRDRLGGRTVAAGMSAEDRHKGEDWKDPGAREVAHQMAVRVGVEA